jgi:hypothetical protein
MWGSGSIEQVARCLELSHLRRSCVLKVVEREEWISRGRCLGLWAGWKRLRLRGGWYL